MYKKNANYDSDKNNNCIYSSVKVIIVIFTLSNYYVIITIIILLVILLFYLIIMLYYINHCHFIILTYLTNNNVTISISIIQIVFPYSKEGKQYLLCQIFVSVKLSSQTSAHTKKVTIRTKRIVKKITILIYWNSNNIFTICSCSS